MIASDIGKELHPSSLEPISPDRAENGCSFLLEIGLEERVAEAPHRQFRHARGMPYQRSALHHARRSDKLMNAATQRPKLDTGVVEIRWLVEPRIAADKDLIGADDESPRMTFRHTPRFNLGERQCTVDSRPPLPLKGLFDCLLVDSGRIDANGKSGSHQQSSPRRAR